jgi:hypothetical protein
MLGNFLYLVGGAGTANGYLKSVERASIDASGAVDPFSITAGVSLSAECFDCSTMVTIGDSLYLFGGHIERTMIKPDGTLEPFETMTAITIPSGRGLYSTAVIGKRVYLLGGEAPISNRLVSIDVALIDSDGRIGQFLPTTSSLVRPRSSPTVLVVNSSLYVADGAFPFDSAAGIERAPINDDGTLGPFQIVDSGSDGLLSKATVVIGNFMYTTGGLRFVPLGPSPSVTTVSRAPINGDGSLGPFVEMKNNHLNVARAGHTIIVLGKYLYVFGGIDIDGHPIRSVERAMINADGSLGSFELLADDLGIVPGSQPLLAIGNTLYAPGGYIDLNPTQSVRQAPLR